jgi:hypothetical protein
MITNFIKLKHFCDDYAVKWVFEDIFREMFSYIKNGHF